MQHAYAEDVRAAAVRLLRREKEVEALSRSWAHLVADQVGRPVKHFLASVSRRHSVDRKLREALLEQ